MLKKIKSFRIKKKKNRDGKTIINSSATILQPKIVLKLFTKVHPVEKYEEVPKIFS
jgi:hypothetical protein